MAIFSNKQDEGKTDSGTLEQTEAVRTDDAAAEDTAATKLHYPEFWDISTKERYIYQYHHKKLPKLKKGQISITGIKFFEADGDMIVDAFIRTTVPKAVEIQEADLVVFDENGQLAAKKRFSLEDLGELPPFTCTPWRFLFLAEDRVSEAAVSDQWKIMFEVKAGPKAETLDLDPAWTERITPENKAQFESMLKKLPPIGPKEVNITGVGLKFLDNQSLQAVVLVRNGTSKKLQIGQLPLTVEDAAGDIVCRGQFKLPPLTVKPRGAKPWAFVYPKDLILKQNPDLSKWRIFVKQKK